MPRNDYRNGGGNNYDGKPSKKPNEFTKKPIKKPDAVNLDDLNQKNYVEKAEHLMGELSKPKYKYRTNPITAMTTTKLRSLLTLINRVENLARLEAGDKLSDELIQDLLHAQIRFAYESAREPSVKEFLELSNLLNLLKEVIKNGSKEKFELLARYFESLVAYHRFFGGKSGE